MTKTSSRMAADPGTANSGSAARIIDTLDVARHLGCMSRSDLISGLLPSVQSRY